jgi:hypothetical protein
MAFRDPGTSAPSVVSQLAFSTAARTVAHGVCSPAVTIAAQGPSGANNPFGISVNLAATAGATLYADSSCLYPVARVNIGTGTLSATFYFEAPAVGAPVISLSAAGFPGAMQTETVN